MLLAAGLLLCWPAGAVPRADDAGGTSTPAAASGGDWTVIHPQGDTGCAFGTPFRFFHRQGPDPSRLMVYFQGGGACWNWVSCSGMFDTSVADDELARYRGIFLFDDPDNPFRGYSVVFIPYCTGDVHVGDTVARYGAEDWDAPAVEHRGHANVSAALDWMAAQLPRPERVVVTGASAGSYGALFHAPTVARLYPSAALLFIGDSGVPLLHGYPAILEQWGANRALAGQWCSPDEPAGTPITLEAAHERLARMRPDAVLAQITADRDAVQSAFYIFSGSPHARDVTLALLRTLERRIPAFRAFVLRGEEHGLMRTDRFYDFQEDGVRLRDWIADLEAGRAVASHYCAACE